jgi:hybrid polyketide synthase/nonribosomal peptide synthetase ACE1
VYKKLDVEQDISEQGFVEHSYDVIVASNVLHATQSLEATLKNTRRLLKPGGSLIILEITAVEWLRSGFMFCGFADWWAGRNDGRQYTPTITQDRWHELFKSTGFSGVDTAVSPRDYMTPYSVILTQAVDTQINSIREPLSKVPERPLIKDVVVLGGNKMTTFDLVDETVTLIQPFASNIRTLAKLEELNTAEFDNDTLILSFAELDEPVFDPFSPEKYSALQRLSERSQNVLWITQGALGEKPHANMMHGIARCLLHERSDSRFQVIDFDVSFEIQPKYIAETFLRLYISHAWSKFSTPYAPQWSFEREIYVGKDGLTVIPRYKYSTVLNERYNASRRLVKAPLDINQSTIEIAQGDFCEIAEVKSPIAEVSAAENGDVKIMVEKSSLRSFKLSDTGYGYLVYGKAADSGKKLLALTGELRSSVWVPESQTIELSIPEDQESAFFSCVANELLAEGLLKSTSKNDHLVIHNAADALINAINRRVAKEKLTLTSDNERGQLTKVIQASTPSRTIQAIIPPNTAVFIDASTGTSKNVISSKIRKILRPASKVLDLSSVMSNHGSAAVNLTSPEAKLALEKACSVASLQFTEFDATNVQLISLDDVSGPILAHDPLTVVDWRAQDSVTARVYPPEDYARFKDDVTYLLVGMTGELGMSLSEWMIERGARNIALTSRSPKVDENWIAAMKDLGARVETFAM